MTNYRCVQSLNISVDVAKFVENVHKLIQLHSLLNVTKKKDLSSLNNLFMARFQLIRCPLMLKTNYRCVQSLNISVDVAKCVENVHTLIHYTHFWTVTKKRLVLIWTIYSWQSFNSLGCPLMLKTNYRCVQSLNISVDDAKCVENVHSHISLHSCFVTEHIFSLVFNILGHTIELKQNRLFSEDKSFFVIVQRWV